MLVGEVILVKPGVSKTFVIVDAAMNDLIRPTLYEAWHDILPVRRPRPDAATIRCDIVGPICESGDYLAQNRDLPPLSAGDLVMIRSAGAYGAVMASSYNTRPLAPEVMVDGTRFAVVRPRPYDRRDALFGAVPALDGARVTRRDAMDATEATPIPAPGVERKIGLAWLALAWEGMWPRLMPLLAVVALFVAAAHLDLFGGLDPWVHTGVLARLGRWASSASAGGASAASSGRSAPRRSAGWSRIPACRTGRWSRCRTGSPRAAHDRMATALWEAHRRREAERLAGLSNKAAHPGLARFDTWALRLVPVLALIVAVASAGGWRTDRMMAAVTPAFPPPPPVVANLWIAPPAYTGKPPIYLDMADHDKLLRVPVGSKLAGFVDDVRGRHAPKLVIDGKETEFSTVSQGKYQVETVITEGSKITLQARGDEQARWKLHVIPDLAPTIEFARPIGVDKWSTKIEYIGGDDFGITGVQLQIRLHGSVLGADMLDEGEEPEVLRVDLPVPGNSKKVSDTFVRDLTAHPWAGLKVRVILFATDALGQKGSSTPETFLLPERVFNDPTARALIVLRKQLTRDPKALRLDVADGMRMIQAHPEVVPRRSGGPARPARRRGAAGGERRQAGDRRHPEAAVGPRDAARAGRHLRRRARGRAGAPGAARRHAAPGRRRGDRAADPAALQRDGPLAEGAGRADEGSRGAPPHAGAGGEDGSQQHHHRRRPAEDARQDSRDGQERPARGAPSACSKSCAR